MDQNQKTNDTSNNQDLDSLLKEFQSLSASDTKPIDEAPSTVNQQPKVEVTNISSSTPSGTQVNPSNNTFNMNQPNPSVINNTVNNINPVQNNNQQAPIYNNQVQNSQQMVNTNQFVQPSVTPMNNQNVTTPAESKLNQSIQQTTSNSTVDMSVLNEEVPVHPDMNVTLNTDAGDKSPVDIPTGNQNGDNDPNNNDGNNKSNLIFMIVIFLIVGAFILFIPKIDSFLKKKPGMEVKPTPTPTAQATNKPVASKEEKTICTMPVQNANNIETQVKYRYYHKDGKVTKLEITTDKKYLAQDAKTQQSYINDQTLCSSLATTYANILGYATTCEEKDNLFSVKKLYDLEDFVNPTTITINGQSETLTSDVNFGDDIKVVKEDIMNQGATCK